VLHDGRSLAKRLRAAAQALKPKKPLKASKAAETVARGVDGLDADARALEVELELLEARYKLNALASAKPELSR
jgi:hypothetical protein